MVVETEWKWTESRGMDSFEDSARWSIDHTLTNTIEILDVMWEAPIHNLSASQMWVTWGVDGGGTKYWLVGEKMQRIRGALERDELEGMQEREGGWGLQGDRRVVDGAQKSH